ncbi:MAG: hypothetical protein V4616_02820, partial [Bacteroidota bacterium]
MREPFSIYGVEVYPGICPANGSALVYVDSTAATPVVEWFDAGGNSVAVGNPMSLPQGEYSIVVTNGTGCSIHYAKPVRFEESKLDVSLYTTPANCTNGAAGVQQVTGGTPPYAYLWMNGATSEDLTGLSKGMTTVEVTDVQGCKGTGSAEITQAISIGINPTVTDATCKESDGAIQSFASGGTPPYSYSYNNGMSGQTVEGLKGGEYVQITATDANGCIGESSAYVGATTPITVTYSASASSCTSPTGGATLVPVGGSAPYTITWGTYPQQTGATLSGVSTGTYSFYVEDNVGCVRDGSVNVGSESTLGLVLSGNPATCPATTGDVTATVTGTDGPFTYLWNNGSSLSDLSSVPVGYYSLKVSDTKGCTITKDYQLQSVSPMTLSFGTVPASCVYSTDGAVTLIVTGGTPNYGYLFNGNASPSTPSNTFTRTNLGTGHYSISVRDTMGCLAYGNFVIGNSETSDDCYCTISGTVYNDRNANCMRDAGEEGLPNVKVFIRYQGYVFTNSSGNYELKVRGGSYAVAQMPTAKYTPVSCQQDTVYANLTPSSGCTFTADFGNTVIPSHDLHLIRTKIDFAIPGNNYREDLLIYNNGTENEPTAQLGFRTDGQLPLANMNPALYVLADAVNDPNWYNQDAAFPVLAPGEVKRIAFNYTVPTNIPINTIVVSQDTASVTAPVSNWVNDETPWNNVLKTKTVVIGSYDPNFKEVSPA